ncbi:MAG: 4-hydroxy-tetrahydrodipicolinate synthase [Candidatus Omnitrophica bacterium]|nr:4-hydroxy-tetrahydrodipicolinate synthase [Candidatus Omnitrophota bacterium]MBU1630251.1 4-hydroxy-tetrahydrodipicolinate synthase [Candidatus Omnitrophota bacterium]MBU1767532.1 4-hydroxy-tetrahydrodipicolinate synthase [Candidatus Omnitrophota bacterium]MBU1889479.1 4-hydroxy-tetrahydrodipicolinate synthase [Candidatus Omnitrophota bacterium]
MFDGSIVAVVTPFDEKGEIDFESLENLIEFHISEKTDGIVPCGCTGEAATLNHAEQKKIIEFVVEKVNGRIPVVAGTGSNSTKESIDLTSFAKKVGADAALIITPYYNKPTPEGQYLHYKKIAEEVGMPVILYNVPGRTGTNMLPETIARLSKVPNIVAIKEANPSLDQVSKIISLCDITVLSGNDSVTLPILSVGGKGVISVAANVVPRQVHELVSNFKKGKLEEAQKIHLELFPLFEALFYETNPIPLKEALALMGKIQPHLRLPLCRMGEESKARLVKVIKDLGLI